MRIKAIFCSALCFLISSCSDDPEAAIVNIQEDTDRQPEAVTQQGVEMKTNPEANESADDQGDSITFRLRNVAKSGDKVSQDDEKNQQEAGRVTVADKLEPNDRGTPFGVETSWFENLSARERERIERLKELPEGISERWFRIQPVEVQAKVLKSDFHWGRQNGDVVLGVYFSENGFISWPDSRKLEGEGSNATGNHLFGYPIVPGVFGEIELQSSF
jgi:hypothetical protein